MRRNLVVLATLRFLPELAPSNQKAKGIILYFENWPPDSRKTDPLVQKLQASALRMKDKFPLFKTRVLAELIALAVPKMRVRGIANRVWLKPLLRCWLTSCVGVYMVYVTY